MMQMEVAFVIRRVEFLLFLHCYEAVVCLFLHYKSCEISRHFLKLDHELTQLRLRFSISMLFSALVVMNH